MGQSMTTLQIQFQNQTTSSEVYAYVTGTATSNNNALFLLQADGKTPYYPTSPSATGAGLAVNCAIPLGAPNNTVTVTIPPLAGGRIWFSESAQLTFLLNPGPALVEPSVLNSSDPNISQIVPTISSESEGLQSQTSTLHSPSSLSAALSCMPISPMSILCPDCRSLSPWRRRAALSSMCLEWVQMDSTTSALVCRLRQQAMVNLGLRSSSPMEDRISELFRLITAMPSERILATTIVRMLRKYCNNTHQVRRCPSTRKLQLAQ